MVVVSKWGMGVEAAISSMIAKYLLASMYFGGRSHTCNKAQTWRGSMNNGLCNLPEVCKQSTVELSVTSTLAWVNIK